MNYGNPQTTQAIVKAPGCSPQTESKVLLLRTTPIQLTKHREVRLQPTERLHPYRLLFWHRRVSLHATKWEMWTPTAQLQTPWSTMVTYVQERLGQWGHKAMGITDQYLIWLKGHSMRWSSYPKLLWWPQTCLDSPGYYKMTPDAILLYSEICPWLSHRHRSFLMQQKGNKHRQPQADTADVSDLSWIRVHKLKF